MANQDTHPNIFPIGEELEPLLKAPYNLKSAEELLRIAVGHMRNHERLPPLLANWLADAIEATHGGDYKLVLKRTKRLPRHNWLEVGLAFEEMIEEGETWDETCERLSKVFHISETTVENYYSTYKNAQEKIEQMEGGELNQA